MLDSGNFIVDKFYLLEKLRGDPLKVVKFQNRMEYSDN